jgi:hypothetical protein
MAKDTPGLQMGDRRNPSRRTPPKRSKKATAQEAEEISLAASFVKMWLNGRSLRSDAENRWVCHASELVLTDGSANYNCWNFAFRFHID